MSKAEQVASSMTFLHSECNYTFNGDAPISGLTSNEFDTLILGQLVKNEQQKEAAEHGPGGRRKYSKPEKTTREAMREYAKKN